MGATYSTTTTDSTLYNTPKTQHLVFKLRGTIFKSQ